MDQSTDPQEKTESKPEMEFLYKEGESVILEDGLVYEVKRRFVDKDGGIFYELQNAVDSKLGTLVTVAEDEITAKAAAKEGTQGGDVNWDAELSKENLKEQKLKNPDDIHAIDPVQLEKLRKETLDKMEGNKQE